LSGFLGGSAIHGYRDSHTADIERVRVQLMLGEETRPIRYAGVILRVCQPNPSIIHEVRARVDPTHASDAKVQHGPRNTKVLGVQLECVEFDPHQRGFQEPAYIRTAEIAGGHTEAPV
jgi:hypothetical protein